MPHGALQDEDEDARPLCLLVVLRVSPSSAGPDRTIRQDAQHAGSSLSCVVGSGVL